MVYNRAWRANRPSALNTLGQGVQQEGGRFSVEKRYLVRFLNVHTEYRFRNRRLHFHESRYTSWETELLTTISVTVFTFSYRFTTVLLLKFSIVKL